MQPTEATIQKAVKSWGLDIELVREIVSVEGYSDKDLKMWVAFHEIIKRRGSPEYVELVRLISLATEDMEGGRRGTHNQ